MYTHNSTCPDEGNGPAVPLSRSVGPVGCEKSSRAAVLWVCMAPESKVTACSEAANDCLHGGSTSWGDNIGVVGGGKEVVVGVLDMVIQLINRWKACCVYIARIDSFGIHSVRGTWSAALTWSWSVLIGLLTHIVSGGRASTLLSRVSMARWLRWSTSVFVLMTQSRG